MKKYAERAIAFASQRGAQAEVFLEQSRSLKARVSGGEPEAIESSIEFGAGVRVFMGNSMGYAYGTDPEALLETTEHAIHNAMATAHDPNQKLPVAEKHERLAGIYSESLLETKTDDWIKLAIDCERGALALGSKVRPYESSWGWNAGEVWIANSGGLYGNYKATHCWAYIRVLASENDDTQTAYAFAVGRKPGDLEPRELGAEAANKALSSLGARRIKSQRAPVLIDPLVAGQLLSAVASALSAEAAQKKKSVFADKEGLRIGSELLNLQDDGRFSASPSAAPFDGEGVPSGKTVLIEQGVLRSFLHNTYTASRQGIPRSTANARRGSFRVPPGVAQTNLILGKGQSTPQHIVSKMKKGLWVTDVSGMHTGINLVSGELSLGASGFWIENGETAFPVREITIAGDILELLSSIQELGDDLKTTPFGGGTTTPSILFGEMALAGE